MTEDLIRRRIGEIERAVCNFLAKSPKKAKNVTPTLHTCLIGLLEAVPGSWFEHMQIEVGWVIKAEEEQRFGMEEPPFPNDHRITIP
jgi:hypothetical protein